MTIRDNIIAFNSGLHSQQTVTKKRILVLVPIAIAASMAAISEQSVLNLYDTNLYTADDTTAYMYLRLFGKYDSENAILGDNPGLRTTYSGNGFAASTVRRGFRLTITDRRKHIYDVLSYLIAISKTSSFNTFKPIKVIDFFSPEPLEYSTFSGELATVRFGELVIDKIPGLQSGYLREDWELQFKESKLRNS